MVCSIWIKVNFFNFDMTRGLHSPLLTIIKMKILKALLFSVTALMILSTLCIIGSTSLFNLLLFCAIDIALVIVCKKTLTLRDIIKFTGYSIWYKSLK